MTDAVERMAAPASTSSRSVSSSHPRAVDCANALSKLASHARLVAVLFADEPYDLALVDELARNGFAGAMLDTAHKTGKTLRDWRNRIKHSRNLCSRCRGHGLAYGVWPARYDKKTFPRFFPSDQTTWGSVARCAEKVIVDRFWIKRALP